MLTTECGKWGAPDTLGFHAVCRKCLPLGECLHRASVLPSHLLSLHPAAQGGRGRDMPGSERVLISCHGHGPSRQKQQGPLFSHTDVE